MLNNWIVNRVKIGGCFWGKVNMEVYKSEE